MRLTFASLALLSALQTARATTVIDFEDWTGGSGPVTSFTSQGFVFTLFRGGSFFISPDESHGNPTLSLHATDATLVMRRADGGTFGVSSLDLQEGFDSPTSTVIGLVSEHPNGDVVKGPALYLDGISSTYETFHPGLENIYFLDLTAFGGQGQFSVDNIIVPEPMILWLIACGALAIRKAR